MKKQYFSLAVNEEEKAADIYIYGDITSFPWLESDVSSYMLSQRIAQLKDVDRINVYINSYGGEVGEGLAIYNALKRHPAKVCTYCDGFAASIASVIFCAGDERYMSSASFLYVHNAWVSASGNAEELRQAADDVEKLNTAAFEVYKAAMPGLSEEEIQGLMDAGTWITPSEALQYGAATKVTPLDGAEKPAADARQAHYNALTFAMRQGTITEPVQQTEPKESPEPALEPKPELEPTSEERAAQMMCGFFDAIFKL